MGVSKKINEDGIIIRNKSRHVAKGYSQEEWIDYDETFFSSSTTWGYSNLLCSCRLSRLQGVTNGRKICIPKWKTPRNVEQPPVFIDPHFPNHVYKLDKALTDLNKTRRPWYETLINFSLEYGFTREKFDTSLFNRKHKEKSLIVQIYVDDIIFDSIDENLCVRFAKIMQNKFEMSMIGELNFFHWIQVKQRKEGIFISQAKYTTDLLKKHTIKSKSTMKNMSLATNSIKMIKVKEWIWSSIKVWLVHYSISRQEYNILFLYMHLH